MVDVYVSMMAKRVVFQEEMLKIGYKKHCWQMDDVESMLGGG